MFCTRCGAELSEQASFCGQCGAPRFRPEVDDPYSEAGLSARGFKLCVSCGSEINKDARICDRCDTHQPTIETSAPAPLPPIAQQDFSDIEVTTEPRRIATVPRRMAAFALDFIIIFLILMPFAFVVSENALLILSLLITICYPLVAEALFSQTIGKRLVGIRVVTDDFSDITWKKSAGRNLLRIVDQLPFLYILGMIMMAVSDKNQRLGDLAARTVVIYDESR